jgi:tetratricopeptide (TPR) repeat protein
MSFVLLFGVIAGAAALTWSWLQRERPLPAAAFDDRLNTAAERFRRGDLAGAIALTRQVSAEGDADLNRYAYAITLLTRALIFRSYSEYNLGADRARALEVAEEAFRRAPSSADIAAAYAYALAVNSQPEQAVQIAGRVLDERPAHPLARTALGLAFGVSRSYEIALRETLRAADSAPAETQVDAQRALAIAYSDAGDYASAMTAIDAAIAANAHLLPLYFERALYALQTGDTDSATVAYYEVLTRDPQNVKARLRLCELSSMLREREAAVDYCTQVIQRAPSYADGWYQLGREYFLQGNFELARTNFGQCTTLQMMQNVPVQDRRFECWYLQGQAAQIMGDCAALSAIYTEFRAMTAGAAIPETWVYPPEGPCAAPPAAGGS